MDMTQSLSEMLAKAAAEVNARGNGQFNPQAMGGQATGLSTGLEPPPVGRECAQRLIDAAEKAAQAIEAHADERVNTALSQVEDAKALQAKAKSVADGFRRQAQEEATRAIGFATKLDDSSQMVDAVAKKSAAIG